MKLRLVVGLAAASVIVILLAELGLFPRVPSGMFGAGGGDSTGEGLGPMAGLFVVFIITGSYILPALIAHSRQHHQRMAITVLDLLAGWTIIGWLVALIWACTAVRQERAT